MVKKYSNGRAPLTEKDIDRKWRRQLRQMGFTAQNPWTKKYERKKTYRLEDVRHPKSAFLYLMDNVMGQNSGKLLDFFGSRGKYYWVERDRERDQSYYIVRRHGNYVTVTQRRWVVKGEGINTFLGSLIGCDGNPVCEDKLILKHPIMEVETFLQAYKAAAPNLNVWDD